jgi:hypothetical protein
MKDGKRDSFWYDSSRYSFTTKEAAELQGKPDHILEVPDVYRRDFLNSPQKALRDLAGRPPAVNSPFFHDLSKLESSREGWQRRYGKEGPVDDRGKIADWFKARDSMKRVMHVDIAYSGEGDALGIVMGHVPEVIDTDGERKPFIAIDMLLRIQANPGNEIFLGDIRRLVYELKYDRKFNIVKVTTDGFQSTDFRQQLQRKRIATELVSVDRNMLPYADLYDALMEGRMAIPPYMTYRTFADPEPIDILHKEMSELQEDGNKIDHPPEGSKDLSDALAGVVFTLMGERTYHSRARSLESSNPEAQSRNGWFQHPAVDADFVPTSAPVWGLGDPTPFRPPR